MQTSQNLNEQQIQQLKQHTIEQFERSMKSGKAIQVCPSCGFTKTISLNENRQYHWRRGKVIHKCAKC